MNNYTIKEIDVNERPMEKLLNYGINTLNNAELLAILIGSGTKEKNAIRLANDLLQYEISGTALLYTSVQQLMQIKGIGMSKASRIIAGLELGKRLSSVDKLNDACISSPQSIADFLFEHFRNSHKEEFSIILLNTKNRIIGVETVSVGTINQSLAHPREVFRHAIMKNANSIILTHNHPSGDPEPSEADIHITQRLVKAGEYIGIRVLDHIIVGDRRYTSLREKNLVRGLG